MDNKEYLDKLREFIAEEVRKEVAKQLQEERNKLENERLNNRCRSYDCVISNNNVNVNGRVIRD